MNHKGSGPTWLSLPTLAAALRAKGLTRKVTEWQQRVHRINGGRGQLLGSGWGQVATRARAWACCSGLRLFAKAWMA